MKRKISPTSPTCDDGRKKLGSYGEKLASQAYIQSGYILLRSQYRCRKGEIDLIFKKDQKYYFVEVRTKSSLSYGTAEESITRKKMQTIRHVALHFLKQINQAQASVQFDVICIYVDKKEKTAQLYRYENAF